MHHKINAQTAKNGVHQYAGGLLITDTCMCVPQLTPWRIPAVIQVEAVNSFMYAQAVMLGKKKQANKRHWENFTVMLQTISQRKFCFFSFTRLTIKSAYRCKPPWRNFRHCRWIRYSPWMSRIMHPVASLLYHVTFICHMTLDKNNLCCPGS